MTDVQICNQALLRLGEPEINALNGTDRASTLCNAFYASTVQEVLRGHRWNFAIKRAILEPAQVTPSGIADSGGLFSVTESSHGLSTGQRVTFAASSNYPQIQATWRVTVVDSNTFTLDDSVFSGSGAVDTTYALAALFGWAYSIALPSDCLRALEDERTERQFSTAWTVESGRVLTDATELEFSYVEDVTTTTRFDPLFIQALILKLAVKLAAGLRGDNALSAALAQEYVALTAPLAKRIDANEGQSRERLMPFQSLAIRARGHGVRFGCTLTCDCD
jgi:hypothetical protein